MPARGMALPPSNNALTTSSYLHACTQVGPTLTSLFLHACTQGGPSPAQLIAPAVLCVRWPYPHPFHRTCCAVRRMALPPSNDAITTSSYLHAGWPHPHPPHRASRAVCQRPHRRAAACAQPSRPGRLGRQAAEQAHNALMDRAGLQFVGEPGDLRHSRQGK